MVEGAATSPIDESPPDDLCAEIFDPSLTRWTIICLTDALELDLSGRKAEVLLRAWLPGCALSDSVCPGLDGHLERLYGVRRTSISGVYTRKRCLSPDDSISNVKRLRTTFDPLPTTSVKATSRRCSTPHIMSSPGPLHHDGDRSYFRAPPSASRIPSPTPRWPVSQCLDFITEDTQESLQLENELESESDKVGFLSQGLHNPYVASCIDHFWNRVHPR